MIEAGIELTLSKLTVKAVAERLGVSIVAIYNNIESIDALRILVAEEILRRWNFPMPGDGDTLEEALMNLSMALRKLVHGNPGIADFLVTLGSSSPSALAQIDAVLQRYAALFDLTPKQAHFAVTTIAEHAVALAELVHVADRPPELDETSLAPTHSTFVPPAFIPLTVDSKERNIESNYEWSMRAVVMGTAIVIDHPRFEIY